MNAVVEVVLGGERIGTTDRAWRVLETSHPPNYYLPREAFRPGSVVPAPTTDVVGPFKGGPGALGW